MHHPIADKMQVEMQIRSVAHPVVNFQPAFMPWTPDKRQARRLILCIRERIVQTDGCAGQRSGESEPFHALRIGTEDIVIGKCIVVETHHIVERMVKIGEARC